MKRSGLFGHSSGASASLAAAAFSRDLSLSASLVAPIAQPLSPNTVNPSLVAVPSAPAGGGGGSGAADLLTDPSWPVIKGVLTLTMAFIATPQAAPPNVRAPVFMLLGRHDSIVPVEQQVGIFEDLGPADGDGRHVMAVMGAGNHCFLDPQPSFPRGSSDCRSSQTRQRELLSPSAQSWVGRRYTVAFFRAALLGDTEAAAVAWGPVVRNDPLMDVRPHLPPPRATINFHDSAACSSCRIT